MASTNKIILFDIPSRTPRACWSLNPWKARLALNYKKVPYTTQWLEYPQIASTLKSYNVPPNTPSVNPLATYSSPCVRLPNGEFVMDSLAIAHALEALQPEPALHLDSALLTRTQNIVNELRGALTALWMPRVPELLLSPESAEYFLTTRSQRIGISLPEMAQRAGNGDVEWKEAEPVLERLSALLREHPEGPFVMGETPSFADFILAGFLRFVERLSVDGDLFQRVIGSDEQFAQQYDACKPWLARDDH